MHHIHAEPVVFRALAFRFAIFNPEEELKKPATLSRSTLPPLSLHSHRFPRNLPHHILHALSQLHSLFHLLTIIAHISPAFSLSLLDLERLPKTG